MPMISFLYLLSDEEGPRKKEPERRENKIDRKEERKSEDKDTEKISLSSSAVLSLEFFLSLLYSSINNITQSFQ